MSLFKSDMTKEELDRLYEENENNPDFLIELWYFLNGASPEELQSKTQETSAFARQLQIG